MTPIATIDMAAKRLILDAFTAEELAHLASLRRKEDRLPDAEARQVADELARIFSSPPLVTEDGTEIANRPTIGFYIRLDGLRSETCRT